MRWLEILRILCKYTSFFSDERTAISFAGISTFISVKNVLLTKQEIPIFTPSSQTAQFGCRISPSPAMYRGRYGTMLFPLALLLKITACDEDKWIFPLNSLVEWGIPLTIGTIPTQVKHWVIFFLVSKK